MGLRTNIVIQGSATAVSAIALFALHATAGRYLGAEEYGFLSFCIAFAGMFVPAFDPGISELAVREVARDHSIASDYVAQAYTFKFVAAPLLFLSASTILYLMLDSRVEIVIGIAMFFSMWLNSLKGALWPIFIAYERFDLNARILIFERIGLLLMVVIVSLLGLGLLGVVGAFLIWRTADLVYTTRLCNRKLVKVAYSADLSSIKTLIIHALPIGAFQITSGIYNYLDTIMIGSMRPAIEVGWYSAAYRLYEGFFLASVVVASVLMPRLSRAYAQRLPTLTSLGAKGLALLIVLGLVCTVGIWLFANQVILLFYGQEFYVSSETLCVLSYGLPLAFIVHFLQTLLISIDRPNHILVLALIGLLFNAALNLYLIPRHGQLGAAWATVASTLFLALCLFIVVIEAAREYHRNIERNAIQAR